MSRSVTDIQQLDTTSGTFNRLKDMLLMREEVASEYDFPVIVDSIFLRMEQLLNQFSGDIEKFRLGFSDEGGIELKLRDQHRGLMVATVDPNDEVSLRCHNGRSHETVNEGKLTDAQIIEFFQ